MMSVSIAHVKGFKIHAQLQTGAYSCLIILPTYLFLFFLNSKAEFVFVNDLLWHVKSHNFKFLAMYLSGNCLKDVTIHPCGLYTVYTQYTHMSRNQDVGTANVGTANGQWSYDKHTLWVKVNVICCLFSMFYFWHRSMFPTFIDYSVVCTSFCTNVIIGSCWSFLSSGQEFHMLICC